MDRHFWQGSSMKKIPTFGIYILLALLLLCTLAFKKGDDSSGDNVSYSDVFYNKLMADESILGTTDEIPLQYDEYTIVEGDNTSFIAQNTGASLDTIISVNKITNAHLIQPGKTLKIPNRNGLLYTVAEDEDVDSIAEKYEIPVETILRLNEITDRSSIVEGVDLFLSGARYTLEERIEMYGLSFFTPLYSYRVTSHYGYRRDPFTGMRGSLHSGVDMAAPRGTSVMAARGGTVTFVGYSGGYGLLVIIRHDEEYSTYYAHLSSARVSSGQSVGMGTTIGGVGSTGRSTGDHLHFEIRRFGTPVDPKWYVSLKPY